MISLIGISSLLVTFVVLYVAQFYYHYFTRPNPLPGPFPLPLIGNAHQSIGMELHDWMMVMHKKYGDVFEVYLTGQRNIVLCRPDLIEKMNIPSTKTKYFNRSLMTDGFVEYGIYGIGVISNFMYDSWKYNRQLFSQAVMAPSFNYQAIEWTNESWKEMESCWNNLGENHELNIIEWMRRFSSQIIFRISTGVEYNSVTSYYNFILENNNSLNGKKREMIEENNIVQSIQIFTEGIGYAIIFNKFVRHYVPFVREKWKNYLKNRDYLFDELHKIIKERRVEIEKTPLDQPLRHDMLTSFITANTSRDINKVKQADADLLRPMTDREIGANITDTIGGGVEGIANLFCLVVYYLGHYPEVKQRVQQELNVVLGKDLTKSVTCKDLDELQYCDAVIKEVYRCFPLIFMFGRVNDESDNIGRYNWSKETQFQLLYSAIMQHKDYWTDPEKFDPDRFYKVEESDKYLLEKQKVKNTLPIFGGGIRICPGKKLAIYEVKCLIALIYRKYDVELTDINAPLKYKSSLANSIDELIVRIKPRKF